ncbi:MAG: hypothetical protein ACYS6K_25515 [Planctomycetota bacterium]
MKMISHLSPQSNGPKAVTSSHGRKAVSNEQPEASEEPSPSFQQAPSSPQQDDWKQPENNNDWQQE